MGTTYSPGTAINDLVFYVDAANPKSYTGSAWQSLIDSTDTFSLTDLTFNTDNGGALNMDAGNETTTFTPGTTIGDILSTGNFAIETITRSDDVVYPRSRHPMFIGEDTTTSANVGWVCGHGNTTTYIQFEAADGTVKQINNVTTTPPTDGEIRHRVFNVSRGAGVTTDYYENAALIGTSALTTVTGSIFNSGTVTFGNVRGWRFIGNLYIIKIYSRTLSQAEITQNFEGTRGRFGI